MCAHSPSPISELLVRSAACATQDMLRHVCVMRTCSCKLPDAGLIHQFASRLSASVCRPVSATLVEHFLRHSYESRKRGPEHSELRTRLKEQFPLPVSAFRFQHRCFAQSAAPDSLIKGLKEGVACHLSGPHLQAGVALQLSSHDSTL